MEIEVVELNDALVQVASELVAAYRFEGGWDGRQQEECAASLFNLLAFGHVIFLVAQHGDKYLGFTTFHWGFSTTKGLPILKIQDVFTLPEYRNRGVARTLLSHTIQIAASSGAHRVQLETDTTNLPARTLYANMGFEWISQKEVYMLPLQQWKSSEGEADEQS
ncbi:GNAT family N-acetyltransferase [Paenibacillus ferrarius]|uniref:GNAT family N-acetyltransferase n=1 Tax=Paenibacillus ferrarius TaxID=1469647 RepID=UPI003D2C997A